MYSRGLIVRLPSPGDARERLVFLTDKGKELMDEAGCWSSRESMRLSWRCAGRFSAAPASTREVISFARNSCRRKLIVTQES
jgi:DNA-binding MarR family transcriptional regulator